MALKKLGSPAALFVGAAAFLVTGLLLAFWYAPTDAVLVGTPTALGNYTCTISVADSSSPSVASSKSGSIFGFSEGFNSSLARRLS